MSSVASPRPDQIAALTQDLVLPLAAIETAHLEVLADGIGRAFAAIAQSAPTVVATGDETEITALLQARLNAMIEFDPLWRLLVAAVVRGGETVNFDGTHLEKRPDLSIHLTARSRRFPLPAEAKLIDADKGEALYCSHGVRRFLAGEYGWGGREAFMIAYVRDQSTIAARLAPYLAAPAHAERFRVESPPVALTSSLFDAALSRHGRAFRYTHTAPPADAPGSIALWHLWFGAKTQAS